MHDLLLLFGEPLFDLPAHFFSDSLDLPGFDPQPSVAEQVFGGLLELRLAAGPCHEAAHPRRIGRVDDVQTFIIREAALAALLALIERASEGNRSQGGQ